jgi:D-galactarolactone isomerase
MGETMAHEAGLQRRGVLRGAAVVLGSAAAGSKLTGEAAAQQVPWSAGTEPARIGAPRNAADCHHHIYDSRFPADPNAVLRPADAVVADYRMLQRRIGTTRNVVVQPSTYGVDNRCLLDALSQFGLATTRGVAVVNTQVSDAELKRMEAAGVCGIRFNLAPAGATTVEMIEPLSRRVEPLGWHIQVNMPPEDISANKDRWNRVPCPIVFDHLAHIPRPFSASDPAYTVVTICFRKGRRG